MMFNPKVIRIALIKFKRFLFGGGTIEFIAEDAEGKLKGKATFAGTYRATEAIELITRRLQSEGVHPHKITIMEVL